MGVKLIKKNGKTYVQLPDSFNVLDEIEFFLLRDNFWLLSAPLGKPNEEKKEQKKLSPEEKSVLHKLLKIRFAERTPSMVEKTFSQDEQNLVRMLIKKGFVQVFYGEKYKKTGVYNVSDSIYSLLGHEEEQPLKFETQRAAQSQPPSQPQRPSIPSYSELSKNGWLVISNPRDAEQFSYDMKKAGLSTTIKGVRGFDGKFYVTTSKFFYPATEKILEAMKKKKEMHLEEISKAAGIEPASVSVVLHILAEAGEVIEKKRDLYCLA